MRWPASSPTWITAPSSPSRLPASSRWRAIRSAWPRSSRSTGSAATSSSTGSTSSAGPCRSPRARCSSGRRSPSRSARSARSSSPRCSSRKRGWLSRRASGSASTARATCGSRSSRTSSGSNRRSAGSSSSPADRPFLPGGPTDMTEVRIGLLGLGTVGAGVAKILESRRAMLEERAGCRLTLAAVADVDLTRPREGLDIKKLPMTPDAARVLADPSVQVIIELVGGLEPARSFILKALGAGKHVVTANKALLAHHGAELYDEARRRGVTLAFEAAVAGGIPLIQAVKEGLVANHIQTVFGIVNGTSNYILSKMTDEGLDFSMVLKEAQAAGYAEADPTLDIEGMDSAHKLQILVTLAFRTFIDLKDIHTEGITRVTHQDIGYARELGYRIKLLAIAKAADGGVEVRVHPTMIPANSPLALELPSAGPAALPLSPMAEIRCCYYLRVMAQDRPGVLSKVAGILGDNDISIANVIQKGRGTREAVPVILLTHEARERDMRRALAAIDRLPDIPAATTMLRVEGGPA